MGIVCERAENVPSDLTETSGMGLVGSLNALNIK